MIRDRYLVWLIIMALALMMIGELIGVGMMNHWKAQGDRLAQPDPNVVRQLSTRRESAIGANDRGTRVVQKTREKVM